jgi:hypothetical protein
MPLIEANGCDFHYEMAGPGRDMVFIHGEIHGLEYWEHQLAEPSTDHRCFAYNRRGTREDRMYRLLLMIENHVLAWHYGYTQQRS